jgi:hypothetical protein
MIQYNNCNLLFSWLNRWRQQEKKTAVASRALKSTASASSMIWIIIGDDKLIR